jgi:hypothetical protein
VDGARGDGGGVDDFDGLCDGEELGDVGFGHGVQVILSPIVWSGDPSADVVNSHRAVEARSGRLTSVIGGAQLLGSVGGFCFVLSKNNSLRSGAPPPLHAAGVQRVFDGCFWQPRAEGAGGGHWVACAKAAGKREEGKEGEKAVR